MENDNLHEKSKKIINKTSYDIKNIKFFIEGQIVKIQSNDDAIQHGVNYYFDYFKSETKPETDIQNFMNDYDVYISEKFCIMLYAKYL